MSKIIEVEQLSKSYQIGHQSSERYLAFRDVLASRAKSVARRFLHPFKSTEGGLLTADEIEEFWALKDVSFSVNQGDRVGIIGRNGAGKSTLLKVLSRITEPTMGRVTLRGRVASLLEVGTGFHPELTGRENIFLNGAILGMTKAEIRQKFDEIVAFAEVERFLDTPVKRYSSGMYVRLAFAVSAHMEPEILIVDEVLAVGDIKFQNKCLGKMEDVGKEGRTVLFVSHNMTTISRLCSKALLLEEGKLIASGSVSDVVGDYFLSGMSNATLFEPKNIKSGEMILRKVILNPNGNNNTNQLPFLAPIVFRIEYEITNKIKQSAVWIAIQTLSGVVVFCSGDYDTNQSFLGEREPGIYCAEVTTPAAWLSPGEYSLIVGLVNYDTATSYEREETLCFRIEEAGSPGELLGLGRNGILQPFLEWNVEKLC